MNDFLTAFIPNLAATLVGVGLGLPIALWLNRLALRGAEKTSKRADAQRVDHALDVLISAMQINASLLRDYEKVLTASKVRWRLGLDVVAWDAIKADFVADLTGSSLRREVAFHFYQLAMLTTLNQEYLQFSFGTNASMSGADATRVSLRSHLKTMCKELSQQSDKLILESKSAKQYLVRYLEA
jgi:hypothetical protein